MSDSAIFARVERELGVSFEEKLRPQIVHLSTCDWSFYPFSVMTLILQSAASVVGAIEAMTKCIPDVVVSLLTCPFSLVILYISRSFLVGFIYLVILREKYILEINLNEYEGTNLKLFICRTIALLVIVITYSIRHILCFLDKNTSNKIFV